VQGVLVKPKTSNTNAYLAMTQKSCMWLDRVGLIRHVGTVVSESDFQKIVINLAKMHGWLVHHPLPSMNRRGVWATHELGDHGFPDLVLAHPSGRVIFAELKSDKGKISPLQSRWITTLQQGAVVWVWRPADLDWIAKYLSQVTLKTS
jgi:hypothetical protein